MGSCILSGTLFTQLICPCKNVQLLWKNLKRLLSRCVILFTLTPVHMRRGAMMNLNFEIWYTPRLFILR